MTTKAKKLANNFEEEFNTLWKMYPNKQGKTRALQSYIKAREKGTTFEEVLEGLKRYINYCTDKNNSWYKPKHGSTWFYQNCWLDEIDEGEKDKTLAKDQFGNVIL